MHRSSVTVWLGFDVEPLLFGEGDALRSRATRSLRHSCDREGHNHAVPVGMYASSWARSSEQTRSDRDNGYVVKTVVDDGPFQLRGGNGMLCLVVRASAVCASAESGGLFDSVRRNLVTHDHDVRLAFVAHA